MAWVRSEAWGQPGLRTSPMPRRYCSTSIWLTRCRAPGAEMETRPRYRCPLVRPVVPPPAGTAHRARPEVAAGGGGGGGGCCGGGGGGCVGGGGGGGAGRVVVVIGWGRVVLVWG